MFAILATGIEATPVAEAVVAELTATVPAAPRAAALPMFTVPVLMVTLPTKLFAPVNCKVPVPLFVILPGPVIVPAKVVEVLSLPTVRTSPVVPM